MKDRILRTLDESRKALEALMGDPDKIAAIERATEAIVSALSEGNAVYSCGNGGSMSDAMHFAEELTGRFRDNRPGLSATAISDPGHISCVANDFGYEHVFSRYLEARARRGDVLLAISTSGSSKNVIRAAEYARENGIAVICLTGPGGSDLAKLSDVEIATVESRWADRVQELHIKIIHVIIELVEERLFSEVKDEPAAC